MRRKFHVIAFLSLLPLLLSCSENSTDPDPNDESIMPLAIGSMWIGRVTEREVGGTELIHYLDTIEIVGGQVEPEATSGMAFVDNRGWEWYFVGDELHMGACYGVPLPVSIECGPLALYPATKGKVFGEHLADSVIVADTSGKPIRVALFTGIQVASTDTTVTVEAGEYQTLAYREVIVSPDSLSYPTINHSYYSPGVGVVLYEQKYESGDIDYRWELLEYRSGKE